MKTARPWIPLALGLALSAAVAAGAPPDLRRWIPLAKDGLHDPASPGTRQLQEPREALSRLSPDGTGNQVRWVQALERGEINPRSNLLEGTEVRLREDDIFLNLNGGTPIVRFPHRAHTLWLDCSNCHETPFVSKTGANRLDMRRMLQGEQCGICHGAVAFPLTECNRCHSVPRAARGAGPAPGFAPAPAKGSP
jgi:c(7)-type cytochrome triheme protein